MNETTDRELLIATTNEGKANEFRPLFESKGIKIKTLKDYPDFPEVEETGFTFEDNALLKAETLSKALNIPVLADDSGLVVDALDGQPGVFSARFAGEEKNDAANNAKLLSELAGIPFDERTAHFHCALALAIPQKKSLIVEGKVEGIILPVPRGENGFGYDSLFFVPNLNKSMAELPKNEKNKYSHRAKAIENMEKKWGNIESLLEGEF
ncbi:XTP/dITP diphosphatase [Lacticigenium naphthae]|uniref:XTP/dITP diphosphatase n=1 Tax=Lacticigenium naphthae TaxID=515351 RepID=UPI00042870BC